MISIIIPLYNKKDFIEHCICSIQMQTYTDWELLIIDDGSTDGSSEIVKTFLNDHRIKYFLKKNGGVSSARNYGIKHAKGEWIIFIDADDYFLPNCLYMLSSVVTKYNTKIVCGNYFNEYKGKRKLALWGKKERIVSNYFRSVVFRKEDVRVGSAMFEYELLKKYKYNEKLWRYEDAEFDFELLRENIMAYTPKAVMVHTFDAPGLSKRAKNYSQDFIFNMNFSSKSFWEKIYLGNLINQGFSLYPDKVDLLKKKYKDDMKWRFYAKILYIFTRIIRKIKKIY